MAETSVSQMLEELYKFRQGTYLDQAALRTFQEVSNFNLTGEVGEAWDKVVDSVQKYGQDSIWQLWEKPGEEEILKKLGSSGYISQISLVRDIILGSYTPRGISNKLGIPVIESRLLRAMLASFDQRVAKFTPPLGGSEMIDLSEEQLERMVLMGADEIINPEGDLLEELLFDDYPPLEKQEVKNLAGALVSMMYEQMLAHDFGHSGFAESDNYKLYQRMVANRQWPDVLQVIGIIVRRVVQEELKFFELEAFERVQEAEEFLDDQDRAWLKLSSKPR